MAFPQTPLDVRVELQINGVWTNVTADVYVTEKISISRGRADEGAQTDPGKCTLTFNNGASKVAPGVSGRYSPRNPRSDLYGLIGRNTPIRVSVPGPTSYLELDGGAANCASTPDAAALDITGDLDLRWEGETDWNQAGAHVLIGKWEPTGNQKAYMLRLEDGALLLHQSLDGFVGQFYSTPLPALPQHAAVRVTLDIDNGAGGRTCRFYWARTIAGPWVEFATPVTASGTTATFASTAPLKVAAADLTTTPARYPFAGRCFKAEVRNGINGTVVASPDFTAQAAGATSFTDSAGLAWTLAGTAAISNRRVRFLGEVPSWPAKWDVSGKDVRTSVEAAGVLRRYGQGSKALDSTLLRRLPAFGPLAYWPMEEGADATSAYSPIAGVRPLTLTNANWAQADSLPSSSPLPVLASSNGGLPMMIGYIPAPATTLTSWQVVWIYRLDTIPTTGPWTFMRVLSTGTVAEWYVQSKDSLSRIIGKDSDGNTVFSTDLGTGSDLFNRWNRVRLTATQSGSLVSWSITWTDVGGDSGSFTTTFTGTVGRPTAVASPPGGYAAALDGMAIGHISAFPSDTTTAYNGAIDAWTGETAGARMIRLGSEEGKPVTVYGQLAGEQAVGPQRTETFLDLLEEAADVDGGILIERRDVLGIAYRDRASLYSQTPALRLDYTVDGHIAPPLEPVDDDQKVRNDVTVTRDGGSSARATLTTGALSTQAPPAGVGVYDESETYNLHDDDQATPIANWLLHLGTVDEARYPVVNLDLAAAPSLVDTVTALECGDRLQIANPPAWLPPGPIDLLMQGYTEVIGHPNDWDLQLNCTPASPWTTAAVAVYEDFEDTDYAVTATDGGTLPWSRSQTHYNTGTWSLRSGAISNNQTSDWIVNVPDGATELTFWYYTSSESSGTGFEGDRLLVLVDSTQALRAQGTTPWTSATITVTGAAAVTFRYAKDNSSTSGEDAVWIDDLTFTTRSPMRADTDASQLAAAATSTATSLSVAITSGPRWVDSATYPAEFPFDITVGGERMRVTAVTGTTSPQTFTVTRSTNGVVKAQSAGTDVRLADPATVAL